MKNYEVKVTDSGTIDMMEGHEITKFYVSYFYMNKLSYLRDARVDLEDLVSTVYVHFLEKDLFNKYDSRITSKKYFIMSAVKRFMIDLCRKHKQAISLDDPIGFDDEGNGLELGDVISNGEDNEQIIMDRISTEEIYKMIDSLPAETNSKVVGKSPVRGEIKMSLREIVYHLAEGFTIAEISEMYINPYNGETVSNSRIQSLAKEARLLLKAMI